MRETLHASGPEITLVIRDYDYLAPLYNGDVRPDGWYLRIDHRTPISQAPLNPATDACELSFSRFLIGLADGDRTFVAVPFFPMRAFRHRCFFVPRGSGLGSLRDLEGQRVGTNSWPDSGNTWSRALLRAEGVRLDRIAWWVGPVDEAYERRPQRRLPSYVREAPEGRFLRDLLLDGELDAVMCPFPPQGFYDPGSPIVRLLPDYAAVERDYYRRTRIYPAHHLVGVRREVFERHPQTVVGLYEALDGARRLWQRRRLLLAELTPWTLPEIEETRGLLGDDWQPNGVTPNRRMIEAFCTEVHAQGLIGRPLDPVRVFAEFNAVHPT